MIILSVLIGFSLFYVRTSITSTYNQAYISSVNRCLADSTIPVHLKEAFESADQLTKKEELKKFLSSLTIKCNLDKEPSGFWEQDLAVKLENEVYSIELVND
jgi:hypothetical protein